MAKNLVIVESPAKAKTINKFLGRDYIVKASMGHVRDLPKSKLGVDEDNDFEPHYTLLPTKKKTIEELKKAAEGVEKIFLAADPDREGEAICWQLSEVRLIGPVDTQRRRAASGDEPAALRALKMEIGSVDQAREILTGLGVDVAKIPDLLAEGGTTILPAPSARTIWQIASVTAKEKRKNPPPPFTTSKLQQDASRRFGFPVAKTMRVAQTLYEGKDVGDRG